MLFTEFVYKTGTYASDLQKNGTDWSYCSLKPVEQFLQDLCMVDAYIDNGGGIRNGNIIREYYASFTSPYTTSVLLPSG